MRRVALVIVVALLALAVFRIGEVLTFAHGRVPIGTDAYSYLGGAFALRAGANPLGANLNHYIPTADFEIPPYLYPPPLAIALIPLTYLPLDQVIAGWLVLIAATTIGLIVVLRHWLGWRCAILAVVFFLPTWESLWLGQINALMALLAGLTLLAAERRSAWSGAWTAIGVLLKIIPGIVLLTLLVQRRWRSVLIGAALIGAVIVATLPFVSINGWISGFLYAATQARPDPLHVSWVAFMRDLPTPINTIGALGVSGALVVLTLMRARTGDQLLAIAAALIVPLLIATVAWNAQMVIALPSLAVLWRTGKRGQLLAAATWFAITFLSGIWTPTMLTLCWAACCCPQLLDVPRRRHTQLQAEPQVI